MKPHLRQYFDQQLESVLTELPPTAHDLLDQVPLVVEDFPHRDVLRRLGLADRRQLCGLYTGIPLSRRSVDQSGVLSDVIHVFREGVLQRAVNRRGEVDQAELRRQIRLTILHELGHHHGMTEDELTALGYG